MGRMKRTVSTHALRICITADRLEIRQERSRAAQDAQSSLDIHTTRLEKVLLATTKHFVKSLLPWTTTDATSATSTVDEGLKSVLTLPATGEEGYYGVRARWGWYREFIRLYSTHLVQLDEVVERDVLGQFKGEVEGVEGRAGKMVRNVWAAGVRGEE